MFDMSGKSFGIRCELTVWNIKLQIYFINYNFIFTGKELAHGFVGFDRHSSGSFLRYVFKLYRQSELSQKQNAFVYLQWGWIFRFDSQVTFEEIRRRISVSQNRIIHRSIWWKTGSPIGCVSFGRAIKLNFFLIFLFLFFRPVFRQQAKQKESDYIFFVDADTHINDYEVLRELLALNKYVEAS